MKRHALPVVLTVVFASTGSLFADCDSRRCGSANSCGNACYDATPIYHNTEFPGVCRECKDEFAFSLWADYCQTKRRGPAYRLPRHKSCLQCNSPNSCLGAVEGNCNNGYSGDNYSVVSPTENAIGETATPAQGQVHQYPAPSQDAQSSIVEKEDRAFKDQGLTESPTSDELAAPPTVPNSPPEPSYYGAPRANSPDPSQPNGEGLSDVPAEVDANTMPSGSLDSSNGEADDADAIRRSVDEAIERALDSGGEAIEGGASDLEDRSARQRSPWFRIFRPRSR